MINFEDLPSDYLKWPFPNMCIDQTIIVEDYQGKTKTFVQKTIHRYANDSGKKFQTKTSGGKLYVKRVA